MSCEAHFAEGNHMRTKARCQICAAQQTPFQSDDNIASPDNISDPYKNRRIGS